MNSTQSTNFVKVCVSKTEDVAASVDMKVMLTKPTGDKFGEARAPLRIEATMSPSREECRNECASFSRFMCAYNAASKEQQLAAGFDIDAALEARHSALEAKQRALFVTTLLMGCFGLGVLAGRCK
jgi:hypothetical protein